MESSSDDRPKTHEGSWYSSDFDASKYMVGKKNENIKAIVAPHAGYKYCATVMGKAYGPLVDQYHTVVVLGTSHIGPKWCKQSQFKSFCGVPCVEQDYLFDYCSKETDLNEHSIEM
jgi:AmmeMemoRadiSam system protein B